MNKDYLGKDFSQLKNKKLFLFDMAGTIYLGSKLFDGVKELLENITAKSIAECAYKGEKDAIEVYETCGAMLGKGLSIFIDVLNPERIVLGSIFQRSESLLRPKMQEILEKECLTYPLKVCEVVPAKLGDNIGDYAALAVASMNREN